jgi:hypothetical protein
MTKPTTLKGARPATSTTPHCTSSQSANLILRRRQRLEISRTPGPAGSLVAKRPSNTHKQHCAVTVSARPLPVTTLRCSHSLSERARMQVDANCNKLHRQAIEPGTIHDFVILKLLLPGGVLTNCGRVRTGCWTRVLHTQFTQKQ